MKFKPLVFREQGDCWVWADIPRGFVQVSPRNEGFRWSVYFDVDDYNRISILHGEEKTIERAKETAESELAKFISGFIETQE